MMLKTHTSSSRSAISTPKLSASSMMGARVVLNKTAGASRLVASPTRMPLAFQKVVAAASATASADWKTKPAKEITVMVVGCTGYIGKFVTKELISRGYNVIAVSREKSGVKGKQSMEDVKRDFAGAQCRFADVTDLTSLKSVIKEPVDVVVSCLASRTGGKKDSWLIDYQATRNSLDAGLANGMKHFVLLSAICVQKPLLEFQRAKLKFEEELQQTPGITYSIVRPTAFMKSIAGQVLNVKKGAPYVMFGDGTLCACKPISEADLADYMANCITEEDKVNKVLPIGGPGRAYTPLDQANVLFRVAGVAPSYVRVPIEIMDGVIALLDKLGSVFPQLEDAAEFGRIGRYYAAESMLVYDPVTGQYDADATPSYGKDTLQAVFTKLVKEGMKGQELGDAAVFGVTSD